MPITTPWETVTPGTSNLTLGNADIGARCRRRDGAFEFTLNFRFGSTTVFSSGAQFTLTSGAFPGATIISGYAPAHVVPVLAIQNGGVRGVGVAAVQITGGETVQGAIGVSPYFGTASMSATNPFTWAAGDVLIIGNAIEAFDN